MPDAFEFDVIVMGGGVAGLWTACHLAELGLGCAVVERRALGAGQTIASQGIIHGGIKYALTGEAGRASRAIARMPEVWRRCLSGRMHADVDPGRETGTDGEASLIDLSRVRVLSEHQHLWTTPGLISRFAAVAASKAIRTPVERLDRASGGAGEGWPRFFDRAPRGVDVYRVAELVLDARSLVVALAERARERGIALLSPGSAEVSAGGVRAKRAGSGRFEVARADGGGVLRSRALVLAAGSANEALAREAGLIGPDERIMQVRPLHMVMALGVPEPARVYGHCLGSSSTPRVTITSSASADGSGSWVWNIGGAIAEAGVSRSRAAQIEIARAELRSCVPWVETDGFELRTARWDRAEGLTADGSRPDEPVVRRLDGVRSADGAGEAGGSGVAVAAWPTKLAFAPELAVRVASIMREAGVRPGASPVRADEADVVSGPGGWRRAEVGAPPWARGASEAEPAEGVAWN